MSLTVNLTGLDDKWSTTSHETCCACGVNLEESDDVPLRLWKELEISPQSFMVTKLPDNLTDIEYAELALCGNCAKKRMGST